MKFPTPDFDKIKVTLRQICNESGTKIINSEVLKIELGEQSFNVKMCNSFKIAVRKNSICMNNLKHKIRNSEK